ncbi:ChuX/HutX family heme-like substrate-binding protein [Methylomonas sp. OY6]|uniref:ChuX/HutX family heme-like substrate-binding protein n=1 Tax=Methylomonas defluvii TaxID=3045149 RepID=A0ABU4UIT7_9GAMM|nr:ChuX/HutX family heme-like substrate-binding protein [Methylomonas sp. OY6]MDX8129394.1 ChuX/HutX family heme-like substrate-binding protein [Methylomonas sp. OY6]
MTKHPVSIADTLKQAWQDLLADHPHMRIRDAAATLGVSEAELLATDCGNRVTRLREHWPALLSAVGKLGPVMALTRNAFAVHESTGLYEDIRPCGDAILIAGHHIAFCLLVGIWHSGFAVTEESHRGPRHSLQFFDTGGEAVHKIYLTEHADAGLYRRLVDIFRADDQSPNPVLPAHGPNSPLGDLKQCAKLPESWRRLLLADTSEAAVTGRIGMPALRALMQQLAELMLPIQVLVGNPGAMQLHDGPIQNLKITGPWFNILDQRFNLHLNEMAVAGADIVQLRYRQHALTGLLVRGQNQQSILTIAGQFDEAAGESALWRDLLLALPVIGRV